MWKDVDILITTDPELLKLGNPWGKKLLRLQDLTMRKLKPVVLKFYKLPI